MVREIPTEIFEKYKNGRTVTFDGEPIGTVKDIVGFLEKTDSTEYVNIVEKIRLSGGGTLFRFAYWTRKKKNRTWTWGQFCLCLKKHQIEKMYDLMRQKHWIS